MMPGSVTADRSKSANDATDAVMVPPQGGPTVCDKITGTVSQIYGLVAARGVSRVHSSRASRSSSRFPLRSQDSFLFEPDHQCPSDLLGFWNAVSSLHLFEETGERWIQPER